MQTEIITIGMSIAIFIFQDIRGRAQARRIISTIEDKMSLEKGDKVVVSLGNVQKVKKLSKKIRDFR